MNTTHTDITERLAALLGRQQSDIEALMTGLSSIINEALTQGDKIALPSFGTFATVKEDEHIINDLTTGERLLMPPSIIPEFQPSSLLKRRLNDKL